MLSDHVTSASSSSDMTLYHAITKKRILARMTSCFNHGRDGSSAEDTAVSTISESRSTTRPVHKTTHSEPGQRIFGTANQSRPDNLERLTSDTTAGEKCDDPCKLCGSLNIEYLISDHPPEGKLYNLDEMIDSASRCETCEYLFSPRNLDSYHCGYLKSVRVSFAMDQPDRPGVLTAWFDHHDKIHHFAERMILAEEGDIASTKYGLLTLNSMGAHTSSPRSFQNARKWLRSCTNDHGKMRVQDSQFRTIFGVPRLQGGPARLIDVSACDVEGATGEIQQYCEWDSRHPLDDERSKNSSRIVDVANVAGFQPQYIALSYRWGSQSYGGYITTTTNLPDRKTSLSEKKLPKTFQDAFRITRELGVRYLWIDAICIIQDSKDDWLQESEKMGSIFANSQLTLFAAVGEDSRAGMFNKQSTYGGQGAELRKERVALCTTVPSSNARSTLYIVDPGFSSDMWRRPHVEDGPLLDRAWCLQEDFLSKRKLYFAKDQLYWHCDHTAISEDRLANSPLTTPTFHSCWRWQSVEYLPEALRLSRIWYQNVIGYDYSRRDMTKATDRLIAVAGLARHVATVIGSRYLAGIWETSILEGLLWWPTEQGRHKEYCAPSWSWACQVGQVEFFDIRLDKIIPGCEYLRDDIEFQSDDVYGGVTRAALTLRSKVVELTVEVFSISERKVDSLPDGRSGRLPDLVATCQGVKGYAYLDENLSVLDIEILAVPITEQVSLIVTGDTDSATHRRIGFWDFDNGTHGLDTQDQQRWMNEVLPKIPLSDITII